ncbi:MAG: hypothetical protein WKG06_19665 [Segetibacter sp.]
MRNEDLNRILLTLYEKEDFNFRMKGIALLDLLDLPVSCIWFLKSKGYINADEGEGWKVWLTLEGQHFIANGGFKDEAKNEHFPYY